MYEFGFVRVGAVIPSVRVADCGFNVQKISELILQAVDQKTQIIAFPELSVTAYTCGDLFFQRTLISEAESAVVGLLRATKNLPVCFIIGAPVCHNFKLYNCAIICCGGKIWGIVPKSFLPNYSEFYEKRWFQAYSSGGLPARISYGGASVPFGNNILFNFRNVKFAVEICEDVWAVIPPSSYHVQAGAALIFNISASDELTGKRHYVKSLLAQQSARCHAAYIYSSAGFGESTTDVVYAGNAYIYENGKLLSESERFLIGEQLVVSEVDVELLSSERRKNTTFTCKPDVETNKCYENIEVKFDGVKSDLDGNGNNDNEDGEVFQLNRVINSAPFIPLASDYDESCEEIFSIQVSGLAKRFIHSGVKSLILGVSGGLDSTLALLACVKMADKLSLSRRVVCGVTMPAFGTSKRTHTNAMRLMESLGVEVLDIDIVAACEQHFKDISHDRSVCDVTFENTQARERTQILMDLANQRNGLVVGTGDMSELALGWATYNGDHISMYGVNVGIPKTLVRYLVSWVLENQVEVMARGTLRDILDTPVSPELLPMDECGEITQLTENIVGPYELHDFFLFYLLRYGFTPQKIFFLATNAFRGIYGDKQILKWMKVFYKRFFSQQFKRSCMPDGVKVGSINLSPRGDWRMPSDACANLWLKEVEELGDRM
ncbi:MAG: NAD(+) synthase [Planctomycetaceae bacterium]|jgi:NAD+ synthase (glutamine-hydrolysing)|nr:NAD(+) synthase [Planctomycetaceae bacterium]